MLWGWNLNGLTETVENQISKDQAVLLELFTGEKFKLSMCWSLGQISL